MITEITGTFTTVLDWIITALNSTTKLFWDSSAGSGSGSFTLLGYLVVIGLSISVAFLLIGVVSNFFHFRG